MGRQYFNLHPSGVINMQFPERVQHILDKLEASGYKAFVVGGAVRDELMGLEPKDWDIATSALPDEVVQVFASADYELSDVNAQSFHVVIVDGIEIATFRRDYYHQGETVLTEPARDIFEDLRRRDLTINAMAISRHGELLDPFGGKEDIENRIVRFVDDPTDRILEDPCRIIRAARFVSLLNGQFSLQTLSALQRNIELVDQVPHERIRTEILKAMTYKKAGTFFEALHKIGALRMLLPPLEDIWGLDGGPYHGEDVFTHSMLVGDYLGEHYPLLTAANPLLRLVGYLHDIGKGKPNFIDGVIHFYHHDILGAEMIEALFKALRFSSGETKYAKGLILLHMHGGIKMTPKTTRKLLRKMEENHVNWQDWLALRVADKASNMAREPYKASQVAKLRRKFEDELYPETKETPKVVLSHKDLMISGHKIQELLGIGPSELIGVILQFLLEKVTEDPTLNAPEHLKRLIMGKKSK